MNLLKAIDDANTLRPNDVPDALKAEWINNLDGDISEMYGIYPPENTFPDDKELLAFPPYEDIYVKYLCAMIDNANEEVPLYQNDMAIYMARFAEFKAAFRRKNRYYNQTNWRTL